MNRPPGQGFPYDQDHAKPAEYGVRPPNQRVLCGFDYGKGVTCRNTAPCPIHRDRKATALEEAAAGVPDPAPGLYEALTDKPLPTWAEMQAKHGPIPKYDPDSPLDLHAQLYDDDQAWSPKTRIAKSLGRRALATRLVDALHTATGSHLLAAELADRLDTLITQAVSETEAKITQELSDGYHAARARLDSDAAKKLREVHDERYKRGSRLS